MKSIIFYQKQKKGVFLSRVKYSCNYLCVKNFFFFSSKNIKSSLRRSTRFRRVVFQEGFVPTINAVPIKGDIPIFDDSSSSSTKENYTAKPSYQNSLSALLREKRIRDKAGYNINVLEKALEDDVNVTLINVIYL
jgi:hypothetical protein